MIDLKEYDLIQIYLLFLNRMFQRTLTVDLCLGIFYLVCHHLYSICVMLIIIFVTNINHLFILLCCILANLGLIIIFKTCPIVLMEKKYLNTSFIKSILNITKVNNTQVNNTQINNTQINNTQINNTQINNTQINNTKINITKINNKIHNSIIDDISFQLIGTVGLITILKLMILIIL
jgi:hypothetical protein